MRRRFRFRLARVLEERRRRERRQQDELAMLETSLGDTRTRRQRIVGRIVALRREADLVLGESTCSVSELRLVQAEVDACLAQAHELEVQLGWFEGAIAEARQRLAALARDRLALERLRDRAHAEFLLELRRAEAAALDDLRRPAATQAWSGGR